MTLYHYATQNNQSVNCVPSAGRFYEDVTHEVGHYLGLADQCKNGTSGCACNTHIMSQLDPNGPARSIQNDECLEADLLNIVPFEDPDQSCQIKPNLCRCQPDDDTCNGTPLVINLATGPYEFTGPDDPVAFDLTSDGRPDRLTWTTAGSNQAFLWRDNNGDGLVTNGAEMFGNYTLLPDGSRAANGFEALRVYDSNGDNVIDQNDAEWSNLKLWFDFNHDGVSQPSEIVPISASNVISISLDYYWSARADNYGNWLRYRSTIVVRGPQGSYTRPVYDVFFLFVN